MQKNRREGLPERQSSDRRWVVQGYMVFRPNSHFNPPTDVIEFNDKLVVLVEIAGMRANEFNITLLNNRLVVTGTRERPAFQSPAYHQVEIGYGEFRVEIALPWAVEQDEVSANYREGFLQVELPRRPDKQIRIINVDTEHEDTE
jgi:HSP20 family protein